MVADTRLAIDSFWVRSAGNARTAPPSASPASPTSASNAASSASANTTLAPSATKCRAMARPTPDGGAGDDGGLAGD